MLQKSRFGSFKATTYDGKHMFIDEVQDLMELDLLPWELLNKIHEQSILDDMVLLFKGLYKRAGELIYHLEFEARDSILNMLFGNSNVGALFFEQFSYLEGYCLRTIRRIAVYLTEASKLYLSKDLIENINNIDKLSWFYKIPPAFNNHPSFDPEKFSKHVERYITEKLEEYLY